MKHIYRVLPSLFAVVMSVPSHADADKKISEAQLPPAVRSAVQHETAGATVKGYLTEVEHGVRVYEVETVVAGHTRDLQFTKDGTLTEVEEEVAFNSLSESVRTALTAKAKNAKIEKVESLTKKGKLVAYEASTLSGNKHGEIQVGPDGKSLLTAE